MKFLLPIDGSRAALAAVRHLLQLRLAGLDASCVLVNVQEPATLYEVVVAQDPETINAIKRDAGADMLEEAEAMLGGAGVNYESEVAAGTPATLVLELLENYRCDAVLVGSHDLGEVTMALLHRSPVPVTLVRVPDLDAEAADQAA